MQSLGPQHVTGGSLKIQHCSVISRGNCSLLPHPQIGISSAETDHEAPFSFHAQKGSFSGSYPPARIHRLFIHVYMYLNHYLIHLFVMLL